MSNEELVIRIKAGDNTADNMLQLYQQVKAFIHSIAWKFRSYEETEDIYTHVTEEGKHEEIEKISSVV